MFAALSNLLKKYGFTSASLVSRGEDFIDVKELISNLTDEQLIRSANGIGLTGLTLNNFLSHFIILLIVLAY